MHTSPRLLGQSQAGQCPHSPPTASETSPPCKHSVKTHHTSGQHFPNTDYNQAPQGDKQPTHYTQHWNGQSCYIMVYGPLTYYEPEPVYPKYYLDTLMHHHGYYSESREHHYFHSNALASLQRMTHNSLIQNRGLTNWELGMDTTLSQVRSSSLQITTTYQVSLHLD